MEYAFKGPRKVGAGWSCKLKMNKKILEKGWNRLKLQVKNEFKIIRLMQG
jgi:hypothetical protein